MLTLDTNVLVYAFDQRYPTKRIVALTILDAWDRAGGPIGLQVMGEAFRVLARRFNAPLVEIRALLTDLVVRHASFTASRASFLNAMELAVSGRIFFWDANLVSAAEAAGCTHLLSEDMQDGGRFGRLEIVNPFAGEGLSPRARDLLSL